MHVFFKEFYFAKVFAALYLSSYSVSARTGGGVAKQNADRKLCEHPSWMIIYSLTICDDSPEKSLSSFHLNASPVKLNKDLRNKTNDLIFVKHVRLIPQSSSFTNPVTAFA